MIYPRMTLDYIYLVHDEQLAGMMDIARDKPWRCESLNRETCVQKRYELDTFPKPRAIERAQDGQEN